MNSDQPPQNLESLLQRLEQAGEADQPVSIECMLQATDERSFGALLLVPGLLVLSPLSGIPGLPSVFAAMVSLIAIQLLLGRERFWLPKWLLRRSASRSKYDKAIAFLHHISGFIDRLLRRRLTFLTKGPATRLNAVLCLAIAATMPPLELIPFGNSIAGAALSTLGLGMMARDGAMIIVALLFFCGLAYMASRLWL
ncbi:exopolysaccharide biosynthesis protein [Pseudomonas stutzeri]|uniref:ABC transporter permease n=1 Tax=Stutzerimonas stutzeri TaxID=316 RepID=A0A2N8S6J3_STUST|nr:exopolysaccharide biosynthesis protein [Stutzerimonas stutzeri]MCQ4294529.1 exopolysaccharide biosynthesis protein [Stutzerimonas stutzeri]PNF82237.1 ABC transporter permease [Stutzerimonas stutzeri]